jgi:hypothetical protein
MNDSKPWWQSRTLLGALITLVSAAASAAGLSADTTLQEGLQGDVMNTLTSVGSVAGAAISIWGRLSAATRLTAS